jgi:hypothetical protein
MHKILANTIFLGKDVIICQSVIQPMMKLHADSISKVWPEKVPLSSQISKLKEGGSGETNGLANPLRI